MKSRVKTLMLRSTIVAAGVLLLLGTVVEAAMVITHDAIDMVHRVKADFSKDSNPEVTLGDVVVKRWNPAWGPLMLMTPEGVPCTALNHGCAAQMSTSRDCDDDVRFALCVKLWTMDGLPVHVVRASDPNAPWFVMSVFPLHAWSRVIALQDQLDRLRPPSLPPGLSVPAGLTSSTFHSVDRAPAGYLLHKDADVVVQGHWLRLRKESEHGALTWVVLAPWSQAGLLMAAAHAQHQEEFNKQASQASSPVPELRLPTTPAVTPAASSLAKVS